MNRIDGVKAFISFLAFSQIFTLCLKNILFSLPLVYVVNTVHFWYTEGVLPYLAGCDVWKVEMDRHVPHHAPYNTPGVLSSLSNDLLPTLFPDPQ